MTVLGLKSEYSLQDSILQIDEIFTFAKLNNYKQIAISDTGNLFGAYKLLEKAKENNISLILGVELTFDLSEENNHQYKMPLLLYPKTNQGFQDLLTLLKIRNYSEKELTLSELKTYCKEIVVVSCGGNSPIYKMIPNDFVVKRHSDKEYEKQIINSLSSRINFYKENIPNFHLGISLDNYEEVLFQTDLVFDVAQKVKVPVLPIHNVKYLSSRERSLYELVMKTYDSTYKLEESEDYSFWSKDVSTKKFSKYKVLKALEDFYKEIKFELKYATATLPKILKESDPFRRLEEITKKRLESLKLSPSDFEKYQLRLNFELDVIKSRNLSNYFLLVYFIVNHAKENNILIGPGRGSSVASLACYLLNITKIDPMEHGLYFERFLNPERMGLPDIDIDIQQDKREELINYCVSAFGESHVTQISTFEKFSARSSIRDILSLRGLNAREISEMIKDKSNPIYKEADDIAKSIEGILRNHGTHPAGILFTQEPIETIYAVRKSSLGLMQIELDINDLEKTNLIKTDFLGLKNLKIISDAINYIKESNPDFDLNQIPLDDTKTYELLSEADTDSIFQLESEGIRAVLKRFRPNNFYDIVNLLALYRPGPLKYIDNFLTRRGGVPFKYVSDHLENILKETYGIILFQEQIMQIAHEVIGYSLAKADQFRKLVTAGEQEKIQKEKSIFINSGKSKGLSQEETLKIFDFILEFASYGFNKAHAVAYAKLTYQMAYLKANYFKEFALSILNNSLNDINITDEYLTRLTKNGIKILPPSIKNAGLTYQIVNKSEIMLPLTLVRGFGEKTARQIMTDRSIKKFESFADFRRKTNNYLTKSSVIKLIFSGALDCFGNTKADLVQSLDASLYDNLEGVTLKKSSVKEYDLLDLGANEKQVYGFNIFYKPKNVIKKIAAKHNVKPIEEIKSGQSGWYLCLIVERRDRETRNGEPMAFVEVSDGVDHYELVCFKNSLDKLMYYTGNEIEIFYIEVSEYNNKTSYIIKDSIRKKKIAPGMKTPF